MSSSLPGSALVVGLARSGQAAALALSRRGVRVVGTDRRSGLDLGRLAEAGVEVRLGTEDEDLVDAIELVIKSPGVPGEAPPVALARERGLPIWSELELGYRLLPGVELVAVTGTNGKTTTSELLGVMLHAPVAGNVGRALCELDGQVAAGGRVVCEVSSFQLEDIHEFRPRAALLLNLEPDHLDRHGSFDAYRDAKLRIFENQAAGDLAVVPRGFGASPGRAQRLEFHSSDSLPAEPRIPGAHNRENAAAATAVARALGVADDEIARALETFRGVPHRLELVREKDGVRYVNDSKATNVSVALRGLAAYPEPLHLILGGSLKGESLAPLARAVRDRGSVRSIQLVGEASDELAEALESESLEYARAGTLDRAVSAAAAAAAPGEIVLLSPACASYDQFENFEQRGDEFRRLVEAL
jgi:UDP-N-acetylmuramoylalanine--D-glutamate ligase